MAETWNKKEKEKKRSQKRKDKEQKKEARKANVKEGASLADMLAYVDENGNITSTPPDPQKKKKIKEEDIVISIPKQLPDAPTETIRKGTVTFFNTAKGYGFIKDLQTQESIFVHANGLVTPIKDNDHVTFEVEMGPKGPAAVSVTVMN